MSVERYICPACGVLGASFDGEPFRCRNDNCGEDAKRERIGMSREVAMAAGSLVYYLALGNRIKIGVTTDLEQRLKVLPHEHLAAFELGDIKLERERHRQFEHARVANQREWFVATPDLVSHIDQLSAGMVDVRLEATRAVKRAILGLPA